MKFDLDKIQEEMDALPKPTDVSKPQPKGIPKSRRERAESAKKREIDKMKHIMDME